MNRTIELTPARVARFWSKVDRQDAGQCWLWLGEKHSTGHGVYTEWSGNRRSLKFYAHRLSLLIAGDEIAGLVVRHDCDNPPCVNPNHLRTGTQADNMQDAVDRNRLNKAGLALGRQIVHSPHPCKRCGATVLQSRRHYCPGCRAEVTRENKRRYRERRPLINEHDNQNNDSNPSTPEKEDAA